MSTYCNGSGVPDPTVSAVMYRERMQMETARMGHPLSDEAIDKMDMPEIKSRLCFKSKGDPINCLECKGTCRYGRRAIQILEQETAPAQEPETELKYEIDERSIIDLAHLPPKQKAAAAKKRYEDAIKQKDPVEYMMSRYGYTRTHAKNFLRWQKKGGSETARKDQKKAEKNRQIIKTESAGKEADPMPVTNGNAITQVMAELTQKIKTATTKSIEIEDEIKKLTEKKQKYLDDIKDFTEALKALRKIGGTES